MWSAEAVTAELRRRGELFESGAGLVGLRGATLRLYRAVEGMITAHARRAAADEWLAPPAVAFETLARAEYFSTFPQWLTAAAHLGCDTERLATIAASADPAAAARRGFQPPAAAMNPAACYHAYEVLAGTRFIEPRRLNVRGTCWRHEDEHFALERGWSFTMHEVVCIGTPAEVEAFRQLELHRAQELADALGIEAEVREATDPFFEPSAEGKALLQRVKALKHELLVPVGGRDLAVASFNNHERFFGRAFDITVADGAPAASGCAAFGIERWLLAFLCAHGPTPVSWPDITRVPLRARERAAPSPTLGVEAFA